MAEFRVWAPHSRRVEVVLGRERHAMTRDEGGWWSAPGATAGARYGFSLDGRDVRPDPRSNFQPDGVLGLSEIVDHAAHRWNDAGWRGAALAGSVIYELHVGTFTPEGTFDSAAEKLSHLVDLGVTAVEIMPVAEFGGDRGWGYDGAALYAPHHAYGGPAGLKRFVDACHAAGLAAVLDVVYNHLGPVGNFLAEFGPYFTDRYHTPWGAAINYDGRGSDEVRRYIVDNALMWIRDYHFDGLRLDAVHAILDESPTHVLEQLAREVHDAHPHAFLIAESDMNDPRLVWPPERGGYGMDGVWSDDWHHSLHALVTGERTGYYEDFGRPEQLAKALRQAWVYDGVYSRHRGRTQGRSPAGVPSQRFVVAAQNHDQVGNRAVGDRLSRHLEAAAALLLTSPFTPMIFQGQEWAASTPFQYFTDHEDPEHGKAVSEGRRKEFAGFGWKPEDVPDPQDPATFERSVLRWDERQAEPHADMLRWYTDLIALRRSTPALLDPDLAHVTVEVDEAARTIVVRRGEVTVAANLGTTSAELEVAGQLHLASNAQAQADGQRVKLPPDAVAILLS
jgi:maltooligosyltrehalose trehalohydrolase